MATPFASDHQPIERVQPGMRVVDSMGADLGKVDLVKMGDAEAVTTRGQNVGEYAGLYGAVGRVLAGAEPDVPAQFAAQLIRVGYIKIDGKGVLDVDRYAGADQIAEVTDDSVRLAVHRNQLIAEH